MHYISSLTLQYISVWGSDWYEVRKSCSPFIFTVWKRIAWKFRLTFYCFSIEDSTLNKSKSFLGKPSFEIKPIAIWWHFQAISALFTGRLCVQNIMYALLIFDLWLLRRWAHSKWLSSALPCSDLVQVLFKLDNTPAGECWPLTSMYCSYAV